MLTLVPWVTNVSSDNSKPGKLFRLAIEQDSSNLFNVPYINLQWNRSLFSAGTFQVEIDYEIYDKYGRNWKAFSVLGEEDSSPFVDEKEVSKVNPTISLCKYVGHCEIALIMKVDVKRTAVSGSVVLSGMMADSLLSGIVMAGTYSAETSLFYATQDLIGNGTYPRSSGIIIYRNQLFYQTYSNKDRNSADPLPPFVINYSSNITTSTTASGTLRSIGERRGCGLATLMYGLEDVSGASGGRWPRIFWKWGEDRSIESGSQTPLIFGVDEGNLVSENVALDMSAGYCGAVTTFTAIAAIGDNDKYGNPGHATHVDYNLSTQLDSSMTAANSWSMGYRSLEDSAALRDGESRTDRVSSVKSTMASDASDYNWETTVTVDASSLPAATVRSIGLGDFVTLHSAITGSYSKVQIVGIREVCKAESHTVELVLGSRQWSNIQRSKMAN